MSVGGYTPEGSILLNIGLVLEMQKSKDGQEKKKTTSLIFILNATYISMCVPEYMYMHHTLARAPKRKKKMLNALKQDCC